MEGFIGEGEKAEGFAQSLWEDEDSKAFYTSLPQLKALLPSILYSESEKATATPVRPLGRTFPGVGPCSKMWVGRGPE